MKRTLILLYAAVVCFAVDAQILWKITGPGLDKPSYVLGSHHVAPAGMLDEVKGLKQAIGDVDAIYGEVDNKALTSPEAQQKIMSYAMAPSDSTILVLMSKEQLDSLDGMLERYTGMAGMSRQMSPLKPSMISTQLSLLVTMKAFPDFDPARQFDVTVMDMGEREGKEVAGFEDLDFQMHLLFDSPISDQIEDLLETVRTEDKIVDYSQRLATAYRSQNLDEVYTLLNDPELGMNEESMHRMVYSRNANWANQLRDILPSKSVLMVVGCGHLPGEQGLLQLLRNQGYKVEALGQ